MALSKSLGHALKIANIVCTILVVSNHYTAGTRNDFFEEFVRNGISRVATPFFALMVGFFLYREINHFDDYLQSVRKRVRSLLIPYLIATVFIAAFMALRDVAAHRLNTPSEVVMILLRSVIDPSSVQLWFLRDVLFFVALSYFLRTRVFWIDAAVVLGLMVCWMLEIQPLPQLGSYYFLSNDVLFFSLLGGLLSNRPFILEAIAHIRKGPLVGLTALWLVLIIWRIAVDPRFDRWYVQQFTLESLLLYKTGILLGVVSVLGWSSRIHSERFKLLAPYTFFVYLFHLQPTQFILYHLVGRYIDKSLYFYVLVPLSLISTFLVALLLSRVAPSLFAMVTGGRSTRSESQMALAKS